MKRYIHPDAARAARAAQRPPVAYWHAPAETTSAPLAALVAHRAKRDTHLKLMLANRVDCQQWEAPLLPAPAVPQAPREQSYGPALPPADLAPEHWHALAAERSRATFAPLGEHWQRWQQRRDNDHVLHHSDRGGQQRVSVTTPDAPTTRPVGTFYGPAWRSGGANTVTLAERRTLAALAALHTRDAGEQRYASNVCVLAGALDVHRTIVAYVPTKRASSKNGARDAKRAAKRDARPVLEREGFTLAAAAAAAAANAGAWHLIGGGCLERVGDRVTVTYADTPYATRTVASARTLRRWLTEQRAAWNAEHAEQRRASTLAAALTHASLPAVSALAD